MIVLHADVPLRFASLETEALPLGVPLLSPSHHAVASPRLRHARRAAAATTALATAIAPTADAQSAAPEAGAAPVFGYPRVAFPSTVRGTPSLVDIDGDGDLDLAIEQSPFVFAKNIGTPTAPAFQTVTPTGAGSISGTPALYDTDGDGDADLVTADADGDFFFYENLTIPALGQPAGSLAFGPAAPFPGATFDLLLEASPALADLNMDGQVDLLAGLVSGDFLFFDAVFAGDLALSVTPLVTTVPAAGGPLSFEVALANNSDEPLTVQARAIALGARPGGGDYVLARRTVTLQPGQAGSQVITADIPAAAPAGTYTIRVEAGAASATFAAEKLGGAAVRATPEHDTVLLEWATAWEEASLGFAVERLVGESGFYERLGQVNAGTPSGDGTAYRFRTPSLPQGAHTLRLRHLDSDGSEAVFAELEVVVGLAGTHLLSEVYPNPFRAAEASFTLAVAREQRVRVVVYDALGREVALVHEGVLPAGRGHRFALDGRGLASGVYVVRVEGETFQEARPVTLLK